MIQITRANLSELAEKHSEDLKNKIESKLNQYPKVKNLLLDRVKLEEILKGEPLQLERITNLFQEEEVAELRKDIEKVFYYEGFYNWQDYNAYNLAKNLQVNVCPYCNRQYTFTIIEKKTNKGKTRPEFDHFFSKIKYPYLALSFYNLIPSCKICNSTFKGQKEWTLKTHIHPYLNQFGNDCKFSLKLKQGKGVDFFYGEEDAFEITLKNNGNEQIQGNINDLCLEQIYNGHKDYVREIIQKSVIYSDSYINSLFYQFGGTLFSSMADIQKVINNNYILEEDLDKRVLSKLTKDISEELGLW